MTSPSFAAICSVGVPPALVANDGLWLRRVDQLRAIQLPGTEAAQAPFFSGGGQSIGFWAFGQLKKVAVSGGATVTVADSDTIPLGAAWGADDVILYRQPGGIMRVSATGEQTDGGYFLGPAFHIQTREEEAFYILEGEVSFYSDEGEIVAGPGTYLNIPKGAKHRFRNNGQKTARILFFFTPAGIEGLFDKLGELGVPAGDVSSLADSLHALGAPYGVEFVSE